MATTDSEMHGKTLALTFGMGLRFVVTEVEMGSSEPGGAWRGVAVYPQKYQGMGGGMMMASLEHAPVFEFEMEDEAQANDLAAAFNYFAAEGKV